MVSLYTSIDHVESLLNKDKNCPKIFPVEIISKKTKLIKASLNIDLNDKKMCVITDEDKLKINIIYRDILGFTISESTTNKRNNKNSSSNFNNNKENDNTTLVGSNEDSDTIWNYRQLSINFFPKYTVKQCNYCGWICSKCSSVRVERKPKNIILNIAENIYEEVNFELKKVVLYGTQITKEITSIYKRKMLLFINPFGGKGDALRVWNQVRGIFGKIENINCLDLANIEIDICSTDYYKHAYDHTAKLQINEYNGIICCSGDGIVHEVINAILHREDKESFMSTCPVGVIPGGSSNGYAKSICEESGEKCTPEICAYIICKSVCKNVDVQEIETADSDRKIYSFLCLAWGLIADVDLESETCRFCGPLRFDMYGALRVICLRKVYGALYYIPEDSNVDLESIPKLKEPLDNQVWIRENEQFNYFWANNVPFAGLTLNVAPKAKFDDGFCDIIKMKGSSGRCNLINLLFKHDKGDYFDKTGQVVESNGIEYIKTKCYRLIPKSNLIQSDNAEEDHNVGRFFSIDGEKYPVGPIQVKTLRKFLKIFCLGKEN